MNNSPQVPESAPRVTCWDGASEATLEAALEPPAVQCVEVGLAGSCDGDLDRAAEPGHLSLVVTTRSAYKHCIVKVFIHAMEHRTALSEDLRVRVYSAVQEALMNAVLHGNLQINPESRGSFDGLLAAHEAIESKLTSSDVAQAPIRMDALWDQAQLRVLVHDSGAGYEPEAVECRAGEDSMGRGLAILQAFSDNVAILDGGTTVELEFRL
ncbi:ATP-binding protein [Bradyrhizobium sp. HKCCYLS20291]|uniref:ATP-binding protein n=1 Tax=Bradyrhizobium sp. HKCCYLS20291 TaxID=3420766 RepID=UPI003EB96D53